MVKKSNTEEFIKKAILIHGNTYDYSKTIYTTSKQETIIICTIHGKFLMKPTDHINRLAKCPRCTTGAKLNQDMYIERVKEIHCNKYDYSKTIYIGSEKKVIIICPIHGEFIVRASSHLHQKTGCVKCANTKVSIDFRSDTITFLKKAKHAHGDRYDYSYVEYLDSKTKIAIYCKKLHHGIFYQVPSSHINSIRPNGCPKCKPDTLSKLKLSNTSEFIAKAYIIHGNKYSYSNVEYLDSKTKVNIICRIHGEFLQNPSEHISKACGCPKCARKGFSKAQIQWLEFLSKLNNTYIQHIMNEGEFTIPTTRYRADGYCKKTNTVYEFHGDYFHGNPKIYKSEELNTLCNTTFGKLYESTVKKEEKIKKLGFNLVIIWESDWNAINKSITYFQKRVRLIINN